MAASTDDDDDDDDDNACHHPRPSLLLLLLLLGFGFGPFLLVSSFVALLSTGLAIIPTHGHIDGNFASSCCWCCSVSHNRRTVIIIIASGSFEFEVAKQMKGSGSQ
jgi:hypothetical protein